MTQTAVPPTLSINLDHEFSTGFTARYIRRKSRQLLGHASLRKSDRPDVEQELKVEVWKAIPNFDPAAGDWKSFVATVVERQAAQLLIRRRAEKRNVNNEIDSLDVLVTDADGVDVPLATQIGREHRSAVTGVYALDEFEQMEMRLDIETLLERLTETERRLVLELAECTQEEVAQTCGLSRRTVRGIIEQARKRMPALSDEFPAAEPNGGCDERSCCSSKNCQKVPARNRADSKA